MAQPLVYPAAATAAAGANSSSSSNTRGSRPVLNLTREATKEMTASLLEMGTGVGEDQGVPMGRFVKHIVQTGADRGRHRKKSAA
jgi:hypothetical protein